MRSVTASIILMPALLSVGAGISQQRAEREEDALLALHRKERDAHFKRDVSALLAHASDASVSVADGKITWATLAETQTMFEAYFKDATFHEWDDLEPPIVRVSSDGSMAWMAVRVRVHLSKQGSDGRSREARAVYAGLTTYEKRDGSWLRVANASTFER